MNSPAILAEESQNLSSLRTQYIDLLKRALTAGLYPNAEYSTLSMKKGWRKMLKAFLSRLNLDLVKRTDPEIRAAGKDWPMAALTMIGQKRLDNVQFCVEQVLRDNIPGDLIEAGVWRGGSCILMRGILKAHNVSDRKVWVADSFQGLPTSTHEIDVVDRSDELHKDDALAVSLEKVKANFAAFGLLDDQVQFLPGWFSESLPKAPVERVSVARLDGDLYQSTMDAISNLYPKLSLGGFLIVDDYGDIPGCRQAVEEYRKTNNIVDPIQKIDWTGVYWRRER